MSQKPFRQQGFLLIGVWHLKFVEFLLIPIDGANVENLHLTCLSFREKANRNGVGGVGQNKMTKRSHIYHFPLSKTSKAYLR